jgi:hypothetical protein
MRMDHPHDARIEMAWSGADDEWCEYLWVHLLKTVSRTESQCALLACPIGATKGSKLIIWT